MKPIIYQEGNQIHALIKENQFAKEAWEMDINECRWKCSKGPLVIPPTEEMEFEVRGLKVKATLDYVHGIVITDPHSTIWPPNVKREEAEEITREIERTVTPQLSKHLTETVRQANPEKKDYEDYYTFFAFKSHIYGETIRFLTMSQNGSLGALVEVIAEAISGGKIEPQQPQNPPGVSAGRGGSATHYAAHDLSKEGDCDCPKCQKARLDSQN